MMKNISNKVHKGLTLVVCLSASIFASAQDFSDMTPEQMEQMMMAMQGGMQEMQECMEALDQTEMAALEQEGEALMEEVTQLCRAGDERGAIRIVREEGADLMNRPVMQEMRACFAIMEEAGGMMAAMMPSMDLEEMLPEDDEVCSG